MPRTVDYPWSYHPTRCPIHGNMFCDWHPPVLNVEDYILEDDLDYPLS